MTPTTPPPLALALLMSTSLLLSQCQAQTSEALDAWRADPNRSEYINDLGRHLKRGLRLTLGSSTMVPTPGSFGYEAEMVFYCEQSPALQSPCRSGLTGADDTIHVAEFPHAQVNVDPNLAFGFVDDKGNQVQPIRLGFMPIQAHDTKAMRSFPQPNDSKRFFTTKLDAGPILLVAIIALAEGEGFSKHVWVVGKMPT